MLSNWEKNEKRKKKLKFELAGLVHLPISKEQRKTEPAHALVEKLNNLIALQECTE